MSSKTVKTTDFKFKNSLGGDMYCHERLPVVLLLLLYISLLYC